MNLREVKRPVFHSVNVIQVVLVGGLRNAKQSIGWRRDRVATERLHVWSQHESVEPLTPVRLVQSRCKTLKPYCSLISSRWLSMSEKKKCHPRQKTRSKCFFFLHYAGRRPLSRAIYLLLRAVESPLRNPDGVSRRESYRVFQLWVCAAATSSRHEKRKIL